MAAVDVLLSLHLYLNLCRSLLYMSSCAWVCYPHSPGVLLLGAFMLEVNVNMK